MSVVLMRDNEYIAHLDEYRAEYLCDTDADFAKLPNACAGSTAVSIASGTVKVVNTSGKWVTFGG